MNKDELLKLYENANSDVFALVDVLNTIMEDIGAKKEDKIGAEIVENLQEIGVEVRCCSTCNQLMIEGYCINSGIYYACSDECLEAYMPVKQFQEEYEDGGESYYTQWS